MKKETNNGNALDEWWAVKNKTVIDTFSSSHFRTYSTLHGVYK